MPLLRSGASTLLLIRRCHRSPVSAAIIMLPLICSFCSTASALPPLRYYLNSAATALLSVLPLPLSLLPLPLFCRLACTPAFFSTATVSLGYTPLFVWA
jgi:hypothetical protein